MFRRISFLVVSVLVFVSTASAQQTLSGRALYDELKKFELGGGTANVNNLVLKRDRGEMTFNGTFYFETPVNGRIHGAIFIGSGSFRAEAPPSNFEKENLRRLLKADVVESDFQTAVLRFTDDTFDLIGKAAGAGPATPDAAKLAAEFEPRLLKETGANISARLAISILNEERPGFFLAQFDKGRRDRFTFMLDSQGRIPVAHFGINGGEKGLIFAYRGSLGGNDVWTAFYGAEDYAHGRVSYSDVFDLVDTTHLEMQVDLRDPGKRMNVKAKMGLKALTNGVRAVPFVLGEDLPDYDFMRLKKNMRLKSATMADGEVLAAVQENWEGGLTVFLPAPLKSGEQAQIVIEAEGDFLGDASDSPTIAGGRLVFISGCYYPWINGQWYPRHGYLRRSTFDVSYLHKKNVRVAGGGVRIQEELLEKDSQSAVTRWKLDSPVALVTFALGPFERHEEILKDRDLSIPVEFHSLSGSAIAIKEDFIVAEMMNSINYFSAIFGKYPYPRLSAVFHPYGFGQGFATLLLIPNTDRASKYTYSFIAHEASHQWWGNIVAWRSYRDQWLSEGFADYSGILYTGLRDSKGSQKELIQETRDILTYPPRTETGVGKGRLVDIGPIILGTRLNTRESRGAYQALIYNKGALVLRMLHFLFTDPQTGNGQPFFDMMADFVKRHQNGWASTENFIAVANEHFVRTPAAKRFNIPDLNWFFDQYVYRTELPSYSFSYAFENQPDGSVILKGTLQQTGVPQNWVSILPLVMRFGKDRIGRGLVAVIGPQSPVTIKLPSKPEDVQLDPDLWVMSEKTQTKK